MGCYDLAQVHGPVTFRVGQPGESYPKIGQEVINVAGLPVFTDRMDPSVALPETRVGQGSA